MSSPQKVERYAGKVKSFKPSLGYGFIAPNDGSDDIFVHQSAIKSDGFRTLAQKEEVEFSISFGENGRCQAIDVTGPNGAPVQGSKRDRTVAREGGCYNCGGEHLQRNCTQGGGSGGRGGNGNDGGCYNCNEVGHIARNCPGAENVGRRGGRAGGGCYNCGEQGHRARECQQESVNGGRSSRACYNCGEDGHLSRDCVQERSYGGRSGGGCYNCGVEGHLARECGQGRSNSNCYTCKKPGHFARDCPMVSA